MRVHGQVRRFRRTDADGQALTVTKPAGTDLCDGDHDLSGNGTAAGNLRVGSWILGFRDGDDLDQRQRWRRPGRMRSR